MRTAVRLAVGAALGLFVLAGVLPADEEKLELDKVPKAVLDAVKAKFAGAELVGAGKEKEKDKVVFEVSIKHKGQNIDVTLEEDGKIIEVEKEIAAKDLPKAVSEALEAKYPKATLKKTEEITMGDALYYEVLFVTADKKKTFEIKFDPKGKVVEEEDKTGKDDKEKKEKQD